MDKAQLDNILVETRQDGDTQAGCAIRKCKRLAPLVTSITGGVEYDNHAVAYIADGLEASRAIVKKWARAGKVLESGIFPEEGPYSIDYYAEVLEWPENEWETVADLTDWADLNATDLKKLRTFVQKMRESDQHWCPCCDHGRQKEWLQPQQPVEYAAQDGKPAISPFVLLSDNTDGTPPLR